MDRRKRHISGRVVLQLPTFLVGERPAHLRGNPGNQRAGRDDAALEHDRSGGHERSRADHRVIQHRGGHPDQAVILDDATVQHRGVPHADPGTHHRRPTGVAVHGDVVLQVAPGTDRDRVDIGAKHGAVEDAGPIRQTHLTNQGCGGCNPGGIRDLGVVAGERQDKGGCSHGPRIGESDAAGPPRRVCRPNRATPASG